MIEDELFSNILSFEINQVDFFSSKYRK